jgi:hypothetical protein
VRPYTRQGHITPRARNPAGRQTGGRVRTHEIPSIPTHGAWTLSPRGQHGRMRAMGAEVVKHSVTGRCKRRGVLCSFAVSDHS